MSFLAVSVFVWICHGFDVQVGLVGGACADVVQTFHRAAKYEKKEKFISILNEEGRNAQERTLVFVETKRQADFLCLNLCEEVSIIYSHTFFLQKRKRKLTRVIQGFPATSIHGDRLQSEREQVLHILPLLFCHPFRSFEWQDISRGLTHIHQALEDFKTGRMPILVATAVAARGLDIPNVMHVVKYVIYFSCSLCDLFFSVH